MLNVASHIKVPVKKYLNLFLILEKIKRIKVVDQVCLKFQKFHLKADSKTEKENVQ